MQAPLLTKAPWTPTNGCEGSGPAGGTRENADLEAGLHELPGVPRTGDDVRRLTRQERRLRDVRGDRRGSARPSPPARRDSPRTRGRRHRREPAGPSTSRPRWWRTPAHRTRSAAGRGGTGRSTPRSAAAGRGTRRRRGGRAPRPGRQAVEVGRRGGGEGVVAHERHVLGRQRDAVRDVVVGHGLDRHGTNAAGSGRSIASTVPAETSCPSQSCAPTRTSGPVRRSTAWAYSSRIVSLSRPTTWTATPVSAVYCSPSRSSPAVRDSSAHTVISGVACSAVRRGRGAGG